MNETGAIRGFKVFNPDWTCMEKQYACPGKFEEDVSPSVCNRGMHFCKKAVDCFRYYKFSPENHVAEVIAYGDVAEDQEDKCATNKLEIVREIPWGELLEIVNMGKGCAGLGNIGDYNRGDYNSGLRNIGDCNSGHRNIGDCNSGNWNSGNCNSGNWNSGNRNSGNRNSGNRNSGDCNSGNCNSGNWNSGNCNSGHRNSGDCNSGHRNSGDCNSGDWNKCNFSNGCFNTIEPKIFLFNQPSDWTYMEWLTSDACYILHHIPNCALEYVLINNMTDTEKAAHPEAEVTGGYLKQLDNSERVSIWWRGLSGYEKSIIKAIPNFDKEIFKEITGIDVDTD